MFRAVVVLSLGMLVHIAGAWAQDSWVLIGNIEETLLESSLDATGAKGRFKAIRLVSRDADITLTGLSIKYNDCKVYSQPRIHLVAGQPTSAIDLQDQGRFVDEVAFRTTSNSWIGNTVSVEVCASGPKVR